jgi:uncharacterized protein YprB with RNaseH-like and TPR domain
MVDIETTNLNADFGRILCASWMRYGEKKPHNVSCLDFPVPSDPTNDRKVVKVLMAEIAKADAWVTWYGRYFDLPFIETRALYYKMKPLPPVPHVDLWFTARKRFKFTNNRLANVQEFLGVSEKTPLTKSIWAKAGCGHVQSIKYIIKHCNADIICLAEVYDRMRAWVTGPAHPNVSVISGNPMTCPTCGSDKVRKAGLRATRTAFTQRWVCGSCGAWSATPTQRPKASFLR